MAPLANKILRRLEDRGVAPLPLPADKLRALQQRWRRLFARALHEQTGHWTYNGYDWHVFSWEYTPAFSGGEALGHYQHVAPCSHLVMSTWLARPVFGFQCDGKPVDLSDLFIDVSVVPDDFAWTMSFTHEAQCGPYFARANALPR